MDDINPKDRAGRSKVPIWLVPFVAIVHAAHAFWDGARKYGPYNWRKKKVSASVYMHAASRHMAAWFDAREECAEDSACHHLGHAIACLSIILDAQSVGNLVDDRPEPGATTRLLKEVQAKITAKEGENAPQLVPAPDTRCLVTGSGGQKP